MEPGWLSLPQAARYAGLSLRTLYKYLTNTQHRLPAYRIGRKWLVQRGDLDAWIQGFPKAGEAVDRVVASILSEFQR